MNDHQDLSEGVSTQRDWDKFVSKALAVWIWSILLGITVSIAVQYMNFASFARAAAFLDAGLVLIVMLVLGATAIAYALWSLVRFLFGPLLTYVFGETVESLTFSQAWPALRMPAVSIILSFLILVATGAAAAFLESIAVW